MTYSRFHVPLTEKSFDHLIVVYVICVYVTYQCPEIRPRVEEGQRRVAHPLAAGSPPAPRVRSSQADRYALGRRVEIQRGFALPVALPAGKARLDRRPLGGEGW